MVYAKLDLDGKVKEVVSHPGWFDHNGDLVDDQILLAEGYIPVDYDYSKPAVDDFYQSYEVKPCSEWTVVIGTGTVKIWDPNSSTFRTEERQNIPISVRVEYNVVSMTVDEVKARLKSIIKSDFEARVAQGFYYESMDARFDADIKDVVNLMALLNWMEETSTDSTTVRTYDNSLISMTRIQLSDLVKEIGIWRSNLYQQKWSKESAIDSCSTIDDLKQTFSSMDLIV